MEELVKTLGARLLFILEFILTWKLRFLTEKRNPRLVLRDFLETKRYRSMIMSG